MMSNNNSVTTSSGRFCVLLILENIVVMPEYLRMKSWILIHLKSITDPVWGRVLVTRNVRKKYSQQNFLNFLKKFAVYFLGP